MGDLTPFRASGTALVRLPAHQLLDRMAALAALSENLRPHMLDVSTAERFERTRLQVKRATAVAESNQHRKDIATMKKAMAAVTTAEIRSAVEEAVGICTAVPAGLDVPAYMRRLMADIAHLAPSRVDFAQALARHRFASKFLPDTADIVDALDAVAQQRIMLPNGLCMTPREILAAIEALPDRVAAASEIVETHQNRIAQCAADMQIASPLCGAAEDPFRPVLDGQGQAALEQVSGRHRRGPAHASRAACTRCSGTGAPQSGVRKASRGRAGAPPCQGQGVHRGSQASQGRPGGRSRIPGADPRPPR